MASTPAAFTPRSTVSAGEGQRVERDWWRAFGSPELDALEARGSAYNLDLSSAEARVREAEALAEISTAPLVPAVDLQAGGGTRKSGPYGARGAAALFASYEIDFWGRNRALARAADQIARAAQSDRDTVAVTLSASIANTYFDVRALRGRLALARRIAADARRLLGLVEIQQRIGTGADLQTELQRNLVASFDQSAAAIERQLEQSQHVLAVLVGRPPEGFFAAPASSAEPAAVLVDPGLPAGVVTRRPDIRAAERRLAAARLDVAAARAAFLPSVSLGAALGAVASPVGGLGVATAALAQPIFHGGALRGQLRYDKAHADELEAAYRQAILAALQDVEDGLSAQGRLRQEEAASDVAVAAARRASFLSQAQYRLGATDYLTVLTAERAEYQAQDQRLQIHDLRLQAAVGLFRALGGGIGVATTSRPFA